MRLLHFTLLVVLAHTLTTVCAKPATNPDEDSYVEDDYAANGESDAVDTDDYGDNGEEPEEELDPPTIESKPLNITVYEGASIELPCDAKNADAYVIMWYKDSKAISQGKSIFGDNPNVMVSTNNMLKIKNINESNAGEYMCKVVMSRTENVNVTHRVFIDATPKIISFTAKDNRTKLDVGETINLVCKAAGEPKPKIKWYFDHKYQGMHGEQTSDIIAEGEELIIENIGYDRTGNYRCLADNGAKHPSHDSIFIEVIHKPVVNIEKIYSDHTLRQLVCIVHASPVAQVYWQKDGKHIPRNDHTKQSIKDHEHRVTFTSFKESDEGEYKCIAKNNIGEETKSVFIRRVPEQPQLVSSKSHKPNGYVLEWTVHSHMRIVESVISYKEKGQDHEKVDIGNVTNTNSKNNFTITYIFKDLKKGSYVVTMKAKNVYGWSTFSNQAHFEITGQRHSHKNKHHSPHTKDMINKAESHTELKELENQEDTVRTGSQISDSGSLNLLPSILLIFTTFILLRP
ncbi:opioid-binding protein/cell adhesion molecule-like isoform X1 [Onthophagus taurus]|uniref:opioid-binding protein/cell adhesion molecule-like isoform X1 n=1 Tax=Onthophagus taurus TaxID=166361 RepID=UPI0039BEB4DD